MGGCRGSVRGGGTQEFRPSELLKSALPGESGIKVNQESYIQGFSRDARATDLSLVAVSHHDMGLVFEKIPLNEAFLDVGGTAGH